ncbi:hypothetical protein L218DRAFT_996694 [Marasmius fiardii PR-910]|nr:hypothetical protein L218DRAFT_996694 [Marasmius fiardii PR-910]
MSPKYDQTLLLDVDDDHQPSLDLSAGLTMRGLAFPSNSISDRESSHEYGTPGSNIDIPLDPALGGPEVRVDNQLAEDIVDVQNIQDQSLSEPSQNFLGATNQYMNQYDQGPQGDPFALPPQTTFFPPPALVEEAHVQTPKPPKRKRKPKREEECGFCQGNDSNNKHGEPEQMLTCHVCGRSGHASCMELESANFEMLRSYPWKCIECKNCEICMEKGDDNRILFCDSCDRGWHMDCLDPPLEEPPTGRWSCPQCPPVDEFEVEDSEPEEVIVVDDTHSTDGPMRETSVASSSRSHIPPSQSRKIPKTKRRGRPPRPKPDSEVEEVEVEVRTPARRGRPPKAATQSPKKGKGRLILEDSEDGDEEIPQSSSRQSKRIRISAPSIPRVRLRLGKGKEREDEELKGMFDDFLGEKERDITNTTVTNADIQRFQRSRDIAEAKVAPPALPSHSRISEPPETPIAGPSSRPLRSTTQQHTPATNVPSASPAVSTPGPTKNPPAAPPALRIRSIRFGPYEIKTWYDAPFPEEYANISDGRLWICEFCLKYMKCKFGAARHRTKCKARHPPGDEIYRDGAVSIFEVDGRKNKIYCQNLCLLSKMYLDHKSLFYDVEPFLFYVMTEVDDVGARFVGYFSKEKRSPKDYNVSCIMTLPVRQRKGWGNLLIDFSYLLSKKEKRTGSPEKPLSGLGALGYKNYWTLSLMRYLETAPDGPLLEDISAATSMTIEDIYNTLAQQGMITHSPASPPVRPSPGQSIKYPKGRKSGIARRHLQRTQTSDKPAEDAAKGLFVAPTHYEIHWDRDKVSQYLTAWEAKGYLTLKPEKLKWSPFFSNHTKKTEALEATDTDKLVMASKLAHQGQEHATSSAPDSIANCAATVDGSMEGTLLSLFDDDVIVLAPRSLREAEADLMDVDGERTTESERHDLPNGNRQTTSQSNQLFTPEPGALDDRLFTPPPDSESPSVELNGASGIGDSESLKEAGVLKDITSQKSLDDVTTVPEVSSVLVKRSRGRPKKTEQQKRQEQEHEMAEPKKKGKPTGRSKKATETSPTKLNIPKRRRTAILSSPESEGPLVANGRHSGEELNLDTEDQILDVKVEDLGTPSTVQDGRHSFPSDVTVKGSDEPLKAANGDTNVAMTFEEDADASADSDADADGDYDMEEMAEMWNCNMGKILFWSVWLVRGLICGMVHSDRIMQYSHLSQGLGDRRDSTLDSNGSTPFQPHQIINQALNPHHLSTTSFPGRPGDYRLSPGPTPSPIHQQQAQQNGTNSHQQASSSSHYNLNANHQTNSASPGLKRKLVDNSLPQTHPKRRREPVEDVDSFDLDNGGQGAKHWTDEEKTKLFSWLMGVGQDEHWQALRSAKNSCLRECANEVFGGKKSYQALKGCFERNFNLFKQIYAFENFHAQQQAVNILSWADADRLKEYERRLQNARRGGCDVGNITARTIDHWHRVGWYSVFHHRWHGDPQTTKPTSNNGRGPHANGDEADVDEGHEVNDFDTLATNSPRMPSHALSPPSNHTNGLSTSQDRSSHSLPSYVNPQSLTHSPTVTSTNSVPHQHSHTATQSSTGSSAMGSTHQHRASVSLPTSTSTTSTPQISPATSTATPGSLTDTTPVTITLTQGMITTYINFMQLQTHTSKMKLEYMKRRDDREEAESAQRREVERLKAEREAQQFEHNKQSAMVKQKTDKAIELLSNPHVDPGVKHSAGEYLKKLFET